MPQRSVFCSANLFAQLIPWGGGPVIQNARIIAVYWGTPESWEKPDSALNVGMDRIYSQIAGSSYLSRLSEYSTGAVKPVPSSNGSVTTVSGTAAGELRWTA